MHRSLLVSCDRHSQYWPRGINLSDYPRPHYKSGLACSPERCCFRRVVNRRPKNFFLYAHFLFRLPRGAPIRALPSFALFWKYERSCRQPHRNLIPSLQSKLSSPAFVKTAQCCRCGSSRHTATLFMLSQVLVSEENSIYTKPQVLRS